MILILAQVLVVFLILYETIVDFAEYRAGKIGRGALTVRLSLLFLVSYVLTDLIVRVYAFPEPL